MTNKTRVLIISAWLAVFAVATASAENVRLTVFHTNDVHGWLMPRPDRKQKTRMVGGAAALAKAVEKHREEGQPHLLLDAGDWFQGTPEGSLPRGRMMADYFNALGYDAVAVGNHEYDIGEEGLKDLVSRIKVPVLGANIIVEATGKNPDYVKSYVIKELAGVKVGIFGVLTTRMDELAFADNVAGLRFEDEIETSRRMVAELRKAGADVIIALSHTGYEKAKGGKYHAKEKELASKRPVGDQSIAKGAPGIDLLVGGHSHTPIFRPKSYGDGTLVVQAWSRMSHLGRVVIEIDPKTKKIVSKKGELIKLWVDEYGEDESVAALVKKYQEDVGRKLDVVIGRSVDTLTKARHKESSVGNWLTDCKRKWTKTQIAIQNGGGVRAPLPAGPVKLRHMYEIMPFDNYVVTVNMTGAQVLDILERGVSGHIGMIQVSGVRFSYDPEAPESKRVLRARVGGEPLKRDAVYSVTAPDFIVQGGDGYAFAEAKDKAFTKMLVRDVLTWCVREYSPVMAKPVDRIMAQTAAPR